MDKEEFLENALKANAEAIGNAKLSDLTNKDSSFYKSDAPIEKGPTDAQRAAAAIDPEAIPQIRTLSGDVAGAVKSDQLSVSRMVLAENRKKQEAEATTEATEPKKKISALSLIVIVLCSMLILGGMGAIGYVLFIKYKPKVAVVTPIATTPTLIRFDEEASISLTNQTERSIIALLQSESKNPPAQDGIRQIRILTGTDTQVKDATVFEFFEKLEARLPDALMRTLQNEFFIGINFSKGAGELFFIIKGESYQSLYPGLLEWEARLSEDVSKFIAPTVPETVFQDAILANQDVRIVSTQAGTFYYAIIDDTYVLFASSETVLTEILKRLREQKLK